MDDARIEIAWNDHVNAFEVIAVLVQRHVEAGRTPLEAFAVVFDQVSVPADYRDKYWRVAIPVIAEHALAAGARPSLAGLDLAGIDLEEGDLRGFDLAGANLRGAFLAGAQLDGAILRGADLADADLAGASLAGAVMPDGTVHD